MPDICHGRHIIIFRGLKENFSSIIIIILPQVNMVNSQAVPAARMFLTTTLAVVMFTVFAQVFCLICYIDLQQQKSNHHIMMLLPTTLAVVMTSVCMCTGCCCCCCCSWSYQLPLPVFSVVVVDVLTCYPLTVAGGNNQVHSGLIAH